MHRFARVWFAAFAVVHVYWATGRRVGVPDSAAPIGDRPAFLTYDLAAAVGLAVVAILVPRLRRGPLVVVGVALLVRGLGALAQDAVTGTPYLAGVAYDVWFAIAGAALLVLGQRRQLAFRRRGVGGEDGREHRVLVEAGGNSAR